MKNDWTTRILELEQEEAGYEGLRSYISGDANKTFIYEGQKGHGFGWAGQVASRIHDVPTVEEFFGRMMKEAEEIRTRWS